MFLLQRGAYDVKYFAFGVTNVGKTGVGGDRLARKPEKVQHTNSGQYFIPFLAFPQSSSWLNAHPEFTVFTADLSGNANSANISVTHTGTPTNVYH